MYQLSASFDVQLPFRLLVKRDEDEELSYEVPIDDFNIKLFLIQDGARAKEADEKYFTFPVSRVKISVTRNESFKPPVNYIDQPNYFEIRLSEYQTVALHVLNRLILFFKYRLHNPLLHQLNTDEDSLLNPKWTNEAGEEVGKGVGRGIVPYIPGFTTLSFGVKKFTATDDEELKQALYTPVVPELYEEILTDAQAAIFQDNLRRAILEMAIACEVAIKQSFFIKSSIAGAAYEYLADKRKINVTVSELISSVAKEAFGESFKDINQEAYQNIDFLFRCRNKIAHRGEVIYRDDAGAIHEVDISYIEKWWKSIEELLNWLKKHR